MPSKALQTQHAFVYLLSLFATASLLTSIRQGYLGELVVNPLRKVRHLLTLISIILLAGGFFIGIYTTESFTITSPQILGFDAAAVSETHISQQEFDAVINQVNTIKQGYIEDAKRYHIIENILKWLGIFASAVITIVAAFSGQIMPAGSEMGQVDQTKLKAKTLRLVGILAAISTICIGLQSPVNESKMAALSRSDQLFDATMTARQKILESSNHVEQRLLLDKLHHEASKP